MANSKTITPEALKKQRVFWNKTQAEMAELLGVSLRTYERWELTGKVVPDAAQAHIRTLNNVRKMFNSGPWADDQSKRWKKFFPMLGA